MIRSIGMSSEGEIRINVNTSQYPEWIKNPENLLWVDISGEPNREIESILLDDFNFHPLAVDDALVETHIPKVDDWTDYLYLVMRIVLLLEDREDLEIETPELDVFLGSNYLVTYHKIPLTIIDTIWQMCQRDSRTLAKGTGNLFYQIADELINQYMPIMERIDELSDQIEDEVFDNPKPMVLNKIFSLKRALLELRRALIPQREVFNKLARKDFAIIRDQDQVYYRDVYDHMVRLQEINEGLRDLISGALETYLSVVNNRMNEVMKTLTVITTLFMPLSFLTGFFGMNFFQAAIPLKIWTGKLVFGLVLAGMIGIPFGMYLWMRRRNWM
ncbi:MAG: magnesium/cobalt transporter CorA [Anaerolineales bacterium]|jgi:magnesium transporter